MGLAFLEWSSSDFLLELFDSMSEVEVRPYTAEDLILQVQQIPALWNKGDKDHSNVRLCRRVWQNIAKLYVEDFANLNRKQQTAEGEKYKTRWRSIRDAYVKFLRHKAEEERSDSGSSKKKKITNFAQQLTFLNASVEPRETQDNFEEQEEAEAQYTSEDYDDETRDVTFVPERRSQSLSYVEDVEPTDQELGEDMEDEVAGTSAPAPSDEAPQAPTTQEEQTAEDIQAQPPRRATPTQGRGRGDEATPPLRRRFAPVHPPTRRETEAEMSGAVSGLLGIIQSHEALITRQLQDGDRGHLIEQYKRHIESLQSELQSVHEHYREEIKLMREVHRAQFDQLLA
ncbi:uncharacterized protein [Hyperolius riggenbachi]|uniref:uncharacterized protein n=1 Tax=Hyperolius riggenbachi TaxID=752182 RepID=UPI0035A37B2B